MSHYEPPVLETSITQLDVTGMKIITIKTEAVGANTPTLAVMRFCDVVPQTVEPPRPTFLDRWLLPILFALALGTLAIGAVIA